MTNAISHRRWHCAGHGNWAAGYPAAPRRRVAGLANQPAPKSLVTGPAERTAWEADIRWVNHALYDLFFQLMPCSPDKVASSRMIGRTLTGRKKHREWTPHLSLDPPPLLGDVVVIMISPKKPSSVGSVARALSCFECPNLLLVAPRCDHLSRAARNSSKGAQYLLWRTQIHPSLSEALTCSNVGISIAFTRWVDKGIRLDRIKRSMTDLQESAEFGRLKLAGVRTALVFGREVEGLTADEVKACDFVCSLPIGRLQESLSISHAVSLALAPLFETRLKSFESGVAKGANPVLPASPDQLAFGVEVDSE